MKFAPNPAGGWTEEKIALLYDRNKRMWEQRMNGETYRSIANSHGLKSPDRVRQIVWRFERVAAFYANEGGCYWGA
jgi:hypothetical protein